METPESTAQPSPFFSLGNIDYKSTTYIDQLSLLYRSMDPGDANISNSAFDVTQVHVAFSKLLPEIAKLLTTLKHMRDTNKSYKIEFVQQFCKLGALNVNPNVPRTYPIPTVILRDMDNIEWAVVDFSVLVPILEGGTTRFEQFICLSLVHSISSALNLFSESLTQLLTFNFQFMNNGASGADGGESDGDYSDDDNEEDEPEEEDEDEDHDLEYDDNGNVID